MKVFINKSDECAIRITSEIVIGTHNKIKCICLAYGFIKLLLLEIVFLRSTTFQYKGIILNKTLYFPTRTAENFSCAMLNSLS